MDVARHPGLMRRKARWYLRAKVPVDLISFLGRHEVWRSLRTGDHALAVKRFRRARADLDEWFEQQRRRREVGERINGEVPRLVVDWFRETEHQASDADFELAGDLLHEALAEARQELNELSAGGGDEEVSAVVDWFRETEHQASDADFELTGDLLHEGPSRGPPGAKRAVRGWRR